MRSVIVKRVIFIAFLIAFLSIECYAGIIANDLALRKPPMNDIKDITVEELNPDRFISYDDYSKEDYTLQKTTDGGWSTINQLQLDSFEIYSLSSSNLKGYKVNSLYDKSIDTAWVEGAKGDGIGEWVNLQLRATKETESSAPFTIEKFSMIPGYAKSDKTWQENNRIKTALLIIYTPDVPQDSEDRYRVFRLQFEDRNEVQVFRLSRDYAPSELMIKIVWLVIEDVFKGSKYSDTCISELILSGGHMP